MQVDKGTVSQNWYNVYWYIFIKEKISYLHEWQKDIPLIKNKLIKKKPNPNYDTDVMTVARDLFRRNENLTSYLSFC